MFAVNVENLIKVKCALYHHWRLQPSELEGMEYWEFEMTVENLQEFLKEKNESERKQQQEHDKSMPNTGAMMRNYKVPKVPNFRSPK